MKRLIKIARKPRRRAAFTLVELLTVIAIIGMLGAISISTVRVSIETARASQTETTLARIDSALTAIYEKYQYRRVDLSEIDQIALPNVRYNVAGGIKNVRLSDSIFWDWSADPTSNATAKTRGLIRAATIRETLRCDLPCTVAEATTVPFFSNALTPLQQSYSQATAKMGANYNAELLYLVVTNADPESRLLFSDREVADTDGNGLFEFVDGWGRPICWLRWAPAAPSSDRQPSIEVAAGGGLDPKLDADPFDPLAVSNGWFLVPYVFSAGPDGEYGLNPFPSNALFCDPFTSSRAVFALSPEERAAAPGWVDGSGTHKDNITNHTLVR